MGGWEYPNTELRGVSACWKWGGLGLWNSQAECGAEAGMGGNSNVPHPPEQAESPSCGREGGGMFSLPSFLVITRDCCFCLGNRVFSHSELLWRSSTWG